MTCIRWGVLLITVFLCDVSQSQGQGCKINEFRCAENDCIPGHWQCDGVIDCVDGLDEETCATTAISLTDTSIQPESTDAAVTTTQGTTMKNVETTLKPSTVPTTQRTTQKNEEITTLKHSTATIQQFQCPNETISYRGLQLTFPEGTTSDENVRSFETCGEGSSAPELPLSTRECGKYHWADPILNTCFSDEDAIIEIQRITNTIVTDDNVERVASDLALVTTQIENLDGTSFDNVAETLQSIVNTNTPSIEVTNAVIATVNNLMNVEALSTKSAVSNNVIVSLERQISNVQQKEGNFTEVQNNLAVKAVKIDPHVTKDIIFLNLVPIDVNKEEQSMTNTFTEDRLKLRNTADDALTRQSKTSIFIHRNILKEAVNATANSTVPISFFIYKDDLLFQSNQTVDDADGDIEQRTVVASQIIGATVEGVVINNLSPESAVVIRFRNSTSDLLEDSEVILSGKCVFWLVPEGTDRGYWSGEGCNLTEKENQTVCRCNHLTSFAVLVGIGKAIPPHVDRFLTVITWVGSLMSILGLVACTLLLVLVKKIRSKQATKIHVNLFLSLIAFYITFLAGDLSSHHQIHCRNIATAVHYFCLTTVCWMSVEAVSMYFLFVKYERTAIRHFTPVACAMAYGLPLLPVIAVYFLAVPEEYAYCFLPTGNALYFGFLLEVFLLVLFNIGIFIAVARKVVFRQILSTTAQKNKKREVIARVQQFFLFWVLLGLSWIFGFLSILPKRKTLAFEILFCIFTSLQGFVLFIFICVKNPEVKKRFVKVKSQFTSSNEHGMETSNTKTS